MPQSVVASGPTVDTTSPTNRQRVLSALACSSHLARPPFLPWGLDVLAAPPHPSYAPLWSLLRQRAVWKRRMPGISSADIFLPAACVERMSAQTMSSDGTIVQTIKLQTSRGSLTAIRHGIAGTSAYEVTRRFLTCPADVELYLGLPYQDITCDGPTFARLDADVGERGIVTCRIPDALGVLGENFEPEPLALCTVEEPYLILSLLEIFAARIYRAVQTTLEGGARPVFIIGGPEFATPPLMPPRCFDEYVVRFDRPLIALIHSYGCKVIVHCHGRLNAVLERFVEMGADGLHPLEAPPMGDITPAAARQRVGKRLCIAGNLQIGDMMIRPPQDIKEQVRQLRQQVAAGLIVTTSATPYEIPLSRHLLQNYEAALDALDE